MEKIAIITDSNSGISQTEAEQLGVYIMPMPFYINKELYYEGATLSQKEFYEKLSEDSEISTSQPSPGDVMEFWNILLKDYEKVIYIPMSSGLSSSLSTAVMLSADYEGKVYVVDNKRISVTLRQSVLDAVNMVKKGLDAKEIYNVLMQNALNASIYITVDTLKYLKKGGRITPAAAAIGTVLNLKPVLQIQGEKLDSYAKVRGWKAAKKTMLEAMEKDINGRFKGDEMYIEAAYTCSEEKALQWKSEIEEKFPGHEIYLGKLPLSVACHIGPGSMAIACCKKII